MFMKRNFNDFNIQFRKLEGIIDNLTVEKKKKQLFSTYTKEKNMKTLMETIFYYGINGHVKKAKLN